MKALVIYTSIHHGNTKKIAEKIAGVLKAKLLKTDEVTDVDSLREYDLIGFGSGIYAFRHHKSLLELVDKLSDQKNKKAFIFSTSGSETGSKFHHALSKKLLDKGFDIMGEFSCKGFDTVGPLKFTGGVNKGRPNEKDLEKAENFAKGLKEKMIRPR